MILRVEMVIVMNLDEIIGVAEVAAYTVVQV
jgi:hypothetical protein